MSYVEDNLMPNEKVLLTAQVSSAVFLPAIILLVFAASFWIWSGMWLSGAKYPIALESISPLVRIFPSMLFIIASLSNAVKAIILIKTTEFAITNRRVIAKRGFIKRQTIEILLAKVESIGINQNILGRIMNFGSVTVVGTGGTKEIFRTIASPVEVKKKVNKILQAFEDFQVKKLDSR